MAPSPNAPPGAWIERHASLPSTNERALELAREGAPAGWVVVADEQTAGRGQRGAAWRSPGGGAGLYASFLVRPRLDPERAGYLTLATGVAAHDAVEAHLPGAVGLKWPNDLLAATGGARGAKVAGILVEATLDGAVLRHAVIGVGVNLRAAPQLDDRRTTCLARLGAPPSADALLESLRAALGRELDALEAGEQDGVIQRWTARALGLDTPAVHLQGDETTPGRFAGLDGAGGAILVLEGGERRTFRHGRLRLALEGRRSGFEP